MTDVLVLQLPAFKKAFKKLPSQGKATVEEVILSIIKNPSLGEAKKGDLEGVFVCKFKIHHQEMLLAYMWNPKSRILMALGVHENFYRDLKRAN